jgi:hypothetical protein
MIPKSGNRFSEKIMLKQEAGPWSDSTEWDHGLSMIPKKPAPDLIRGGNRFSEKIMLK